MRLRQRKGKEIIWGLCPRIFLITLHEIHLGSVLPTPFCSGLYTKNPLVTSGSVTISTNESKRLDTLAMGLCMAVYVLHQSISRLPSQKQFFSAVNIARHSSGRTIFHTESKLYGCSKHFDGDPLSAERRRKYSPNYLEWVTFPKWTVSCSLREPRFHTKLGLLSIREILPEGKSWFFWHKQWKKHGTL